MKKRRTFTPEQKTPIVLELLKEEESLNEIAARYEIQPAQITCWKSEFLNNASRAFSKENDETDKLRQQHGAETDVLHRQLGQLTVENNWLKKNLEKSVSPQNRRNMVDRNDTEISVFQQFRLLGVNRSTLYYKPNLGTGRRNIRSNGSLTGFIQTIRIMDTVP